MEAVSNHLEQLAQQLHRAFVNRVNQRREVHFRMLNAPTVVQFSDGD